MTTQTARESERVLEIRPTVYFSRGVSCLGYEVVDPETEHRQALCETSEAAVAACERLGAVAKKTWAPIS